MKYSLAVAMCLLFTQAGCENFRVSCPARSARGDTEALQPISMSEASQSLIELNRDTAFIEQKTANGELPSVSDSSDALPNVPLPQSTDTAPIQLSFGNLGSIESDLSAETELSAEIYEKQSDRPLWESLTEDHANYYSRRSLLPLAAALGAGAAMANTNVDRQLQKHFQSSVRGATSDEWFEYLHANKELGNGMVTLPIMGALWIVSEVVEAPPAVETTGKWAQRSLRGFVVGAPPVLALQLLTGGSRPDETFENSEWQPMRDNNGVSGHAFMSSLPFITAAKMSRNPWQKSLWYAGSTIGPLSRVNDNAHYPSQIVLGWTMAFAAASAIQQTESGHSRWAWQAHAPDGGEGLSLQYRW